MEFDIDVCPDEAGPAKTDGIRRGCPTVQVAIEGPNVAILLNLEPESTALENAKQFETWNGLADAILKSDMCAWVQTFSAADDDSAARSLGQRRATAAEAFLLSKGFSKERMVVEPNADPSELIQRGLDAERLRNGILLTPREDYECPAPTPSSP